MQEQQSGSYPDTLGLVGNCNYVGGKLGVWGLCTQYGPGAESLVCQKLKAFCCKWQIFVFPGRSC